MTTESAPEAALDGATGWLIVAIGVCLLTVVWGTVFTFTVYAGELARTFGLSPVRVASVFSITTALFLVAGGSFGVFAARLPLRPVVATAGVAIGVAVGLLQVVSTYLGVVAAFGLLGAASGTTVIVVVALVPQWFDAYKGLATGIALIGNGVGVLVLPFVWVWLFARTDVRGAFLVVGGAMVAFVLLASLVYRRPPGRTRPDTTVDVTWLRRTFTDGRFLGAVSGFALLWTWYFVLSSQLVDMLTTFGIDATVASTAFGTIGGVSVLSRVGSGAVADRVGMRRTFLTGVSLAAIGVLVLLDGGSSVRIYASLVLFGVGLGAVASLYSPIIIERFGPENATAIVGLFNAVEAVSAFCAPLAASALVGLTGGYALLLVSLSGVTFLGAGLFYWGTDPTAE